MRCASRLRGCWHYSSWSKNIPTNKSKSSFYSRECSAITERIKMTWLLSLSVAHMDGVVGSEGAEGIWFRLHPLLRYQTGCIQDAALLPAFSLHTQRNYDGNFENVLAYFTAHQLSRTPKPWRIEETIHRPGTIKVSGSLSSLSRFIDCLIMPSLLSSVLCALRREGRIFIGRIWTIEVGTTNLLGCRDSPSIVKPHVRGFSWEKCMAPSRSLLSLGWLDGT